MLVLLNYLFIGLAFFSFFSFLFWALSFLLASSSFPVSSTCFSVCPFSSFDFVRTDALRSTSLPEQPRRLPPRDSKASGFLLRHPHLGSGQLWAGISHGRVWLALGGKHYSRTSCCPLCGGGQGTGGAGPPPTPPRDLYQPSSKASENERPPSPQCVQPQESWALLPLPGSRKACHSLGPPARPVNHLTFGPAGPFPPGGGGQESFLTFLFPAGQMLSGRGSTFSRLQLTGAGNPCSSGGSANAPCLSQSPDFLPAQFWVWLLVRVREPGPLAGGKGFDLARRGSF